VSELDVATIKRALEDAGIEVYRAGEAEIQVAERVRLHIMDSGVRIVLGDQPTVRFTARSQRSDFPNAAPDDLFARVRTSIGTPATARGFQESTHHVHEVKDPVDESKVLDVWHEVTYEKPTDAVDDLVEEVRWALGVEKYVTNVGE